MGAFYCRLSDATCRVNRRPPNCRKAFSTKSSLCTFRQPDNTARTTNDLPITSGRPCRGRATPRPRPDHGGDAHRAGIHVKDALRPGLGRPVIAEGPPMSVERYAGTCPPGSSGGKRGGQRGRLARHQVTGLTTLARRGDRALPACGLPRQKWTNPWCYPAFMAGDGGLKLSLKHMVHFSRVAATAYPSRFRNIRSRSRVLVFASNRMSRAPLRIP